MSSVKWWQFCLGLCVLNTQLALRRLAQRWPNVNPYVGPTSAHQRWFVNWSNVGPTVAHQRWTNVVPTSAQRWRTNVGPTLAQRYANGCTNSGLTEAALMSFCEGNPWSVTDGFPSQRARNAGVDVCLNNRLNKQSSWVTSDLIHQCDGRQCNIQMSKDVTVLFRRCAYWSKHNVQKDNGLSLAGAKPILSEPTLLYIVNWTLKNKLQWKFNRNSYICIQENAFAILSGPQWVNMNKFSW